jgi:hypothetical protein
VEQWQPAFAVRLVLPLAGGVTTPDIAAKSIKKARGKRTNTIAIFRLHARCRQQLARRLCISLFAEE